MMKRMKKRGLSPVIATMLLVAMTIALALIVFLWFRSFNQEAITKFGGTNIDIVCQQVQFDANYDSSSDTLSIQNSGNVPVYSFSLQIQKSGSQQTIDMTSAVADWPKIGLPVNGVYSGAIDSTDASGASTITVIPVLRGTSSSGIKTHVCSSQYGKQLTV
ncbi:MAG: archaellin/type IV pilin N-terminal domain-containing protein [Candidatus Pacearchaeota archaeon]|jgi:flagellin-like protein